MVHMMVHSKGHGGKYFCSLYFQVKSVFELDRSFLMALFLRRDVS